MKRKLFKKVLLTLTVLFGLSGVVNAQDLKRDSPEIVKLAKEDLNVLINEVKVNENQRLDLYEIFLNKNYTFSNQKGLSVGRKNLIVDNYLLRINLILSKNGYDVETLLNNKDLLKKVGLLKETEIKSTVKK